MWDNSFKISNPILKLGIFYKLTIVIDALEKSDAQTLIV